MCFSDRLCQPPVSTPRVIRIAAECGETGSPSIEAVSVRYGQPTDEACPSRIVHVNKFRQAYWFSIYVTYNRTRAIVK
jgi:hypothetical protein